MDYIFYDFLQSQTPSGLPLSRLNLKVRAPIIIFCNLYSASTERNITQIIIIQLERRCIDVCIFGEEFYGQLYLILRIKLTITKSDRSYILNQRQYPIGLCFAIIVNKSQG